MGEDLWNDRKEWRWKMEDPGYISMTSVFHTRQKTVDIRNLVLANVETPLR